LLGGIGSRQRGAAERQAGGDREVLILAGAIIPEQDAVSVGVRQAEGLQATRQRPLKGDVSFTISQHNMVSRTRCTLPFTQHAVVAAGSDKITGNRPNERIVTARGDTYTRAESYRRVICPSSHIHRGLKTNAHIH